MPSNKMRDDISTRLEQVLSSDMSEESAEFILALARQDLTLTCTSNPEVCTSNKPKNGLKNGLGNQNQRGKIKDFDSRLEVEIDTFIVSLLQEITGKFSIDLKFDDSLLQNHGNLKILTQPLGFHKRTDFLKCILKWRGEILETRRKEDELDCIFDPFSYHMTPKISEILRLFKYYFDIEFCVNILSKGKFRPIMNRRDCDTSTAKIRTVYLTKHLSEFGFSAIVSRRRMHEDERSYLTALANDISQYHIFQHQFDLWTKSEHADIENDTANLTHQLTQCKSINKILPIIFKDSAMSEDIFPFNILKPRMNDPHLDKIIYKEILCLIKNHVEDQLSYSVRSSTAQQLETTNLTHQNFSEIEGNAPILIQEAEKFCETEKKKIQELEEEMKSIESTQSSLSGSMGERGKEILNCQQNLSRAKGFIAWTQFKSQLELHDPKFMDVKLQEITNGKRLEEILDKIKPWFKFSAAIVNSRDFIQHVKQNKTRDIRDLINVLNEFQNVHIPPITNASEELEIFGRHIFISNILTRIRERSYSELRIVASGILNIDTDITTGGKNLLLCSDEIFVNQSREITISSSGSDGKPFPLDKINAEPNSNQGGLGIPGDAGDNGSSAGHVTILSNQPIKNINNLRVEAKGGGGSKGQNGGKGGFGESGDNGKDGHLDKPGCFQVWSDYKMISKGEDGKPGKSGGIGGAGGRGGRGGSHGKIYIKSGNEEIRVENETKGKFVSSDGKAGDDGVGGDMGEPGQGGRNGSDYGYATESFYSWDGWNAKEGKFDFVKVPGFFKGGYKFNVRQTKEQVHQTFAKSGSKEQNVSAKRDMSDPAESLKSVPTTPNQEINQNSQKVVSVLKKNAQVTQKSEIEALAQERRRLEEQLNSISCNEANIRSELENLNKKLRAKEDELELSNTRIKMGQLRISTIESSATEAKLKKLEASERVEGLRKCMDKLNALHKKFQEENKLTAQVQEQVETKICSDFPIGPQGMWDGDGDEGTKVKNKERDADWSYISKHNYIQQSNDTLSKLEGAAVSIRDAFERCLQTAIWNSVADGIQIPDFFFPVISNMASNLDYKPRGYTFVEFVSEILPNDLRISLLHSQNENFCSCLDKFENTKSSLFSNILQLRTKKFETKKLIELEEYLNDEKNVIPESLQTILEDILERNFIEQFVEYTLNSKKSYKERFKEGFSKFSERYAETGNLFGEDEEEDEVEEAEEKFEQFDEDEISDAKTNAEEDLKFGNISEDGIRLIAQKRLELFKELKSYDSKIRISKCLNEKDAKKEILLNSNAGDKFIADCTGYDLKSIQKIFESLLATTPLPGQKKNVTSVTNLFPLFCFIIPKLSIDLPTLSTLYKLSQKIRQVHDYEKLETSLYQIYQENFLESKIKHLEYIPHLKNHSEIIQALLESRFTDLSLEKQIDYYNEILTWNEESFQANLISLRNSIGKFEFKSKNLNGIAQTFNSKQNTKEFIHLLEKIVSFLTEPGKSKHAVAVSERLTNVCFYMNQFEFEFTDLKKLKESIFKLAQRTSDKHFNQVLEQLAQLFQKFFKSSVEDLRVKFDLNKDGKTRKKMNGILELIEEIVQTSDLANSEQIIFTFKILLERIYNNLIQNGTCSELEQLSEKIEELKTCGLSPDQLISDLFNSHLQFLREREECDLQIGSKNVKVLEMTQYEKLQEYCSEYCCTILGQNVSNPKTTDKICHSFRIFSSVFMSNHSEDMMENFLSLELNEERKERREAKNRIVVALKQLLNNTIEELNETEQNNDILDDIMNFRNLLNWSTRAIYNQNVLEKIYQEGKFLRQKLDNSSCTFENSSQGLFKILESSSVNLNDDSRFRFLEECREHLSGANSQALVDETLLRLVVKSFIKNFMSPDFEFLSGENENWCSVMHRLAVEFFEKTFPSKPHDESEAEKRKRQNFAANYEQLMGILAVHCWTYPKELEKLSNYFEAHLTEFSQKKKKSFVVHAMTKFIEKVFIKLLGSTTLTKTKYFDQIENIVLQLTNTTAERHYFVLKILVWIKIEQDSHGELDEKRVWKSIKKIKTHLNIDFKSIKADKSTSMKTKFAHALLNSDFKRDRKFLLRILSNAREDWSPDGIQEYLNSPKTNTSFWMEIFKTNIQNLLNPEEYFLFRQCELFHSRQQNLVEQQQAKYELIEKLKTAEDSTCWTRIIREFIFEIICEEFLEGELEEELKHELHALHFFSLKSDLLNGEHRFWSIIFNICQIFRFIGDGNPMFKKMIFKYAQHIDLKDFEDILKSKFTQNWILAILKGRLMTSVKEALIDLPSEDISKTILKLETSLSRIREKRLREDFIQCLGDSLLKICGESLMNGHSSVIKDNLETICYYLDSGKVKVTNDLVEELKTTGFTNWKICFRKKQLVEMGLTQRSIDIIKFVLNSNLIDEFLQSFKCKFCFKKNESLLNQILIKIEGGEWFIDDELLEMFRCEGLLTEEFVLDAFREAVEKKRGKDIEGEELINKLISDATGTNAHLETELKGLFRQNLLQIKRNFTNDYPFEDIIKKKFSDWTKSDIYAWSKAMKRRLKNKSRKDGFADLMTMQVSVLTAMCKAVHLWKGYYPWDTQILSIMIFLHSALKREKGRLGQISTGEGKTLITAMLAIIWALPGSSVNVITSTNILAEENLKEVADLFSMFKISVTNNCDKACQEGGDNERRKRNLKQVIYGDLSSFQSEILQTENFGKNLLNGRKVDYVLVDEADNMLLDKGGHMLYISHPIIELRHCRPIFVKIWEIINDSKEMSSSNINVNVSTAVKILRKLLDDKEIKIPKYLRSFVNKRVVTWVKNGFQAKSLTENDPYIVSAKDGKEVVIIDNNTGLEQSSMQYSFGLHQFLQLKHSDKLSCENLKAVFMSNYSYFNRYKGSLYGITGTLGSEKSKEIMARRYTLDFFSMERHKFRYCPQEESIVVEEEGQWLEAIKTKILEKKREGRAVLVIVQNIVDIKKIKSYLDPVLTENFKVYESSTDKEFLKYIKDNEIPPGMVIVGTNLAGRGTDLKISKEVQVRGGLHVIVSFMPSNSRIGDQAEGRTGRKGEPGSTQYILLCPHPGATFQQLKLIRDDYENKRLDLMDQNQLPQVDLEEQLFKKFQEFIKKAEKCEELSILSKNIREQQVQMIRNRWALWLDAQHEVIKLWKIKGVETILNKFSEFENETNLGIQTNSLAQFPSELVKLAKEYEQNQNLEESIKLLSDAYKMDPDFGEIPLYYKAYCILKESPNCKKERKNGIKLLKKAQTLIHNTISTYVSLPGTLDTVNAGNKQTSKNFSKQINAYCTLLKKHSQTIDDAVGVPVNHQLLRQVSAVTEMKEALELMTLIRTKLKPLRKEGPPICYWIGPRYTKIVPDY